MRHARLFKEIAQLVHKRLGTRIVFGGIALADGFELTQQFFLPLGQIHRAGEDNLVRFARSLDGGQLAGLRARFLVVAPDVEFLARQFLKDSGLADVVVVAVLSNLPEGRWYLLADPMVCPVVAVLRLAGSTSRILVEPHKMPIHTDSAGVRVRCDTGAALVRRQGIVRGGTA